MFPDKWHFEKGYRFISIGLFFCLFVYLFLRALYIDILHDEAATFLHYIETGYFFGPNSIVDANNHLLNSVVCRGIYKLFGENFFMLRLPNLLSFPIYFWALTQLISIHKNYLIRLFVLVGTTCIPFILEYFANCRGYGISLAFFLAALVFLSRLSVKISVKNHLLVAICLAIAAYSNLTFLVSIVLAALFILIQQFRQKESLGRKKQIVHLGIHLLFATVIVPAGIFARVLKEGGALYYGSMDGFWEVTGTTLSRYTIYTDVEFLKWIFLLIGILMILVLILKWLKIGFSPFFSESETMLGWFFFGHVVVILILANFMEVNYPEDRVGMYLIILALLLLARLIERIPKGQFLFLGFLFFPISMIPKMNLDTSVFSPDDRMTQEFYDIVYKELDKGNTSVTMYHLMNLTWPMHNRYSEHQYLPAISGVANQASDIILSRTNLFLPKKDLLNYDTLFLDKSNGFLAFKRKKSFQKTTLVDTLISKPATTFEFAEIHRLKIPDSLKNCKIQLHVSGVVGIDSPKDEVVFTYSVFNKNGENSHHDWWTTRWYNGVKNDHSFILNYPIEKWNSDNDELRLYFFNPHMVKVQLKNIKLEILKLD